MAAFDQFANQGGPAAWDPDEKAEATRLAEETLQNADYAGDLPEPLGSADDTDSGTASADTADNGDSEAEAPAEGH